MRLFHVITSGSNCAKDVGPTIESILKQRLPWGWGLRVHAIDDASTDATWSQIVSYVAEGQPVTPYKNNENRGAAYSRMRAIRGDLIADEDVCVLVGMDGDQLAHDEVLWRVSHEYDKGADLTYGSWKFLGMQQWSMHMQVPYTEEEIDEKKFREVPWRCQPLQSFSAGLVKDLPDSSFQLADGSWLPACTELALLVPALERAREIVHIDEVLYLYNYSRENATLDKYGDKKKQWHRYIVEEIKTPDVRS